MRSAHDSTSLRADFSQPLPPMPTRPAVGLTIPLWLVWLVAAAFVFAGLGGHALLDNNEGLYAEIPREMLAANDWRQWVIPHLNGLPYMEKPPLLYWLTALSFSLFGMTEFAARLVPALSALGCVALLLGFACSQQRTTAGRLAAVMFISGIGVCAMSRVLMFDMLLTAMLTGALMYAYRFVNGDVDLHAVGDMLQPTSRATFRCAHLPHLYRAHVFLALAVMAKGLVALVLFILVASAMLAERHRSPRAFLQACTGMLAPRALLIFAAIVVPWHVAASLIEPIFAWFYFINEHVLRFLGKREPHDYYAGAWWYYLPRMVLYLFPWSLLLPCLLLRARAATDTATAGGERSLSRFLLIAWLLPLLFFSISSAKANYYLVAVMPFAALHLSIGLEKRGWLHGAGAALPGVLAALLAVAGLLAMRNQAPRAQALASIAGMGEREFISTALLSLMALALVAAALAWRVRRIGVLAYLPLSGFIVTVLALVLTAMAPLNSTQPLVRDVQAALPGHAVYLFRDFEQLSSLPFYLNTPVPVIDSRSNDLYWGNKLQANDRLIDGEQFARRLPSQKVVVVVRDRYLADFRLVPYFGKFSGSRRIGENTLFFN